AERTSNPWTLRPRSMKSTIPGSSSIRTMFATRTSYERFPLQTAQREFSSRDKCRLSEPGHIREHEPLYQSCGAHAPRCRAPPAPGRQPVSHRWRCRRHRPADRRHCARLHRPQAPCRREHPGGRAPGAPPHRTRRGPAPSGPSPAPPPASGAAATRERAHSSHHPGASSHDAGAGGHHPGAAGHHAGAAGHHPGAAGDHHIRGADGVRRLVMAHTPAAPFAALSAESWDALGTTAVLRHEGPAHAGARMAVERELDAIDAAASRFRADSELSRLNAMPATAPRTLLASPLFAQAVRLAIHAADASRGAVDPTLAPELAGLGYDRDWDELIAVPSSAPLADAERIVVYRSRRARWEEIEVDDDPARITLPAGVQLDLGATAKALAADRAAQAAHEASGVGVLVALGGDIATSGPPPSGGFFF